MLNPCRNCVAVTQSCSNETFLTVRSEDFPPSPLLKTGENFFDLEDVQCSETYAFSDLFYRIKFSIKVPRTSRFLDKKY